jgi:hypothetical protein
MTFEQKPWLDRNLIEAGVLGEGGRLHLHSVLWNGAPPKDVLVFLLAGAADGDKVVGDETWGSHIKRLLELGFRFDFLREAVAVKVDNQLVPIFGGDGAPIFGKNGVASVRLIKKLEDGIYLIVQVGAQFKDGIDAAQAVKAFFGQFGENAIQICQTYAAPFGLA